MQAAALNSLIAPLSFASISFSAVGTKKRASVDIYDFKSWSPLIYWESKLNTGVLFKPFARSLGAFFEILSYGPSAWEMGWKHYPTGQCFHRKSVAEHTCYMVTDGSQFQFFRILRVPNSCSLWFCSVGEDEASAYTA